MSRIRRVRWVLFAGGIALCLIGRLAYTASEQDISTLRSKTGLLDSLTAQLHQLFLMGDEKVGEAEERMSEAPFLFQGRLTTEPGVPVSTSDRTNQTTVYFTPYKGSKISLYNGTTWAISTFTERSLVLAGLTANRNYDVFLYNNSGTLQMELSAAWTNNFTRADALTKQDGVYIKNSATTRRYLGTIRATAATQTQDTRSQRFVWNYFNRMRRLLSLPFTGNSWNYGTAAFRAVNADNTLRVEYVNGQPESTIVLRGLVVATAGATNRTNISLSFGMDTDGVSNSLIPRGGAASDAIRQQLWVDMLEKEDGLGYHYIQAIEYGNSQVTFYGDDGGDARLQSGMLGWLDG